MKEVILKYVPGGAMGINHVTYWEVVNRELCLEIWKAFPIKGLSIRMEVQGMSSGGIPGHRASTVTIGDMEPWVSMVNTFPGCDGMDKAKGNSACTISPSWGEQPPANVNKLEADAKAKAGQHDKARKCDFCT